VDDPHLTAMLGRLAVVPDRQEQRLLLHDVQRYVAKQVYYIYMPSGVVIAAWDGALKNYAPNMGYDYGGVASSRPGSIGRSPQRSRRHRVLRRGHPYRSLIETSTRQSQTKTFLFLTAANCEDVE
jgi:hypothetical protein